MIIAILEDSKGFRKTIMLSEPMRGLKIPLPFIPEIYTPTETTTSIPSPSLETLEFEFYKELETGKVFLFKEKIT